MFINSLLLFVQKFFEPFYKKSFVLQRLDWLIFINIIFTLLVSLLAPSDFIAYFALIVIILTIIKVLVKPSEIFELSLADKFLLLYFVFVLISVAGSSLLVLSIKGFSKTLVYLGFYIAFIHYLKDNKQNLKYIFLALTFSVFVESFVAIKQNFISVSEISGWQDMSRLNAEEIMTRVYGTLKPYNPNLFGGYMVSILPATLALFFTPLFKNRYLSIIIGASCFFLGIITIIMTGCRGAYLGLFAELLVLILFLYKFIKPDYKKLFIKLTTIAGFLMSLLILSKASLRARIFSIFAMRNDSSNSFRFNVYNSCVDMFKDNWLVGIGVGNQNFREIYGLYMKTGFDALSAYNIYLETAVESGIFALLTFISFLAINVIAAYKFILKQNNCIDSFYLSITLVSLIGMLVHGLVDTVFFRPQIQFVFWTMVGIIRVITWSKGNYAEKRD